MLEVKNLTKIYKSKGGIKTKALDNISVSFPETGMVFLLGKSGSGKSTLLNVCGGLDSPTSGEIIIKGRSSKNFKQSDFDSYRNTFLGFVFQEYNILNEFTVEENIGLALELQNKSKDKKAIGELLEKVDLTGYAKRKPNTLSGGQKQRIAIARALIKSPEIIMADEPTGALDSVTGKQVLDTLKKLSKDTLVIVVSHDREFANFYGDRIIELKDGKIISDISKENEQTEEISQNISVVGNTLCIKKGSKLDEKEFREIKEFINDNESDIILTKGEDADILKKAIKINKNGEKEVFKETDVSKIITKTYKKEESEFIRSKLPIKHAFRIGVSSLKNKPFRLFVTIILCCVAFVMFGILSTMNFYNNEATFKKTLNDSNYSLIKLGKLYQSKEIGYSYGEQMWNYTSSQEARFTKNEFKNYIKQFGNDVFTGINTNIKYNVQNSSTNYWVNIISTLAYTTSENSLMSKINGYYPKNDDEILISSYTANVIYNTKIYDGKTNKILNLFKPEDIIGNYITLGNQTYKVVGIFDSGEIDVKYEALQNSENKDYNLEEKYLQTLYDELHLIAFITENKLNSISKEYIEYVNEGFDYQRITTSIKNPDYKFDTYANSNYGVYLEKNNDNIIYLNEQKTPSKNEVIITSEMLGMLMMNYYEDKMVDGNYNATINYELALQIKEKGIYNENGFNALSDDELNKRINQLLNNYKREKNNLTIGFKLYDDYNSTTIGNIVEVNVIGIINKNISSNDNMTILLSNEQFNELVEIHKNKLDFYLESQTKYEPTNSIYQTIYIPFNKTEEEIETFWSIYENKKYDKNDTRVTLNNSIIQSLEMVDSMVDELSTILFYAGLVLAIFAILLFSNFISVSISNKKKEIGILRAIGARSIDVFKIFFSESFVIAIICVLLSLIGCNIISNILNRETTLLIGVPIFVFGIISILLLMIIAIVTAILSTLVPVYKAAKRKPVDSIRAI